MARIDDYAKAYKPEYLVKVPCETCGCGRWAELIVAPNAHPVFGTEYGHVARCIKCSTTNTVAYKWTMPTGENWWSVQERKRELAKKRTVGVVALRSRRVMRRRGR